MLFSLNNLKTNLTINKIHKTNKINRRYINGRKSRV
jgi:hypothetical protein